MAKVDWTHIRTISTELFDLLTEDGRDGECAMLFDQSGTHVFRTQIGIGTVYALCRTDGGKGGDEWEAHLVSVIEHKVVSRSNVKITPGELGADLVNALRLVTSREPEPEPMPEPEPEEHGRSGCVIVLVIERDGDKAIVKVFYSAMEAQAYWTGYCVEQWRDKVGDVPIPSDPEQIRWRYSQAVYTESINVFAEEIIV